jgi:hypothetical protein
VKKDAWNAFFCKNTKIGVLNIDSLDGDTMDRSVQPVYIKNYDTGLINKLNNDMDHCWDGVYTCQKRRTRFHAQLQTDKAYVVEYTGTPPGNQKFYLTSGMTGTGVELKVQYPESGAYEVYINNVEVTINSWDASLGAPGLLTKTKGCGEYRYVGVKNYLDVFMTPGCELEIRKRDGVLTNVRMEWTVADFYADGGTDKFADRVAAALGIHKSRVKVVAVYEGSVKVQYLVLAEKTDTNVVTTLKTISSSIETKILATNYYLGAPIIGVDIAGIQNGIDILNPPVIAVVSPVAAIGD